MDTDQIRSDISSILYEESHRRSLASVMGGTRYKEPFHVLYFGDRDVIYGLLEHILQENAGLEVKFHKIDDPDIPPKYDLVFYDGKVFSVETIGGVNVYSVNPDFLGSLDIGLVKEGGFLMISQLQDFQIDFVRSSRVKIQSQGSCEEIEVGQGEDPIAKFMERYNLLHWKATPYIFKREAPNDAKQS